MSKPLRLCFQDTETSGLAETVDEAIQLDRRIIEYAFCIWEDGQILKRFERKVMPTGDALADAIECAAKGYNHFDPKEWWTKSGEREYTAAKPWDGTDCEHVFEHLNGEVMAGSNPRFDLCMFKAEFARLGFLADFPKLATHRMLDIGQGAWFLWSAGLVDRTGLEPLAKYLGVEHKAHTATGDVLASIACFERLCDEYIFRPRKLRDLLIELGDDCGVRDVVDAELATLGAGL